jgi:hypothetical protein
MRISNSNVVVNIQRSDERVQEQESKVTVLQAPLPNEKLVIEQARLDFAREDTVSLSSQSLRYEPSAVSYKGGASSEIVHEQSSERVVGAVLEGFDAWHAISLQGVSSAGAARSSSTTLLLQVEQAVTQQVAQSTLFTANGTVTDSNGATISFQLGLALESKRELKAQSEFTLVTPPRTDPLVINFDTSSAQLTDLTFDFDLNADGRKDTIAQLGSGSGYLVFDSNGNGVVDSGNELFGVHSGDGFADLRQLNSDRDLWLDENDAAFSQLSLWVRDETGSSALFSLRELGIGAIYLGATADDFELTSSQGIPLGSIRAHSVVLMENGDVRTAQQLDLVNQKTGERMVGSVGSVAKMDVREMQLPAKDAGKVAATEYARQAAIGKLEELREQQAQYHESLREQGDTPKSLLQQLLEKMEQMRERYREVQAQRERVDRLYLQRDSCDNSRDD